ncbi:hypothetical protein FKM82_023701 [Ascaphus truei]
MATWNINVSVLRFQLIPRLRCMGGVSAPRSKFLSSFARSSAWNDFITMALLAAILCNLRLAFAIIFCASLLTPVRRLFSPWT